MKKVLEPKKRQNLQALSGAPLPLDDIHYLWPMVQRHFVRTGDYLWLEGEPNGRWGMVARGQIKVLKETEYPGHPVVLGVFGPGSLIFDSSFDPGRSRDTTAVAMEDVEILYLSEQQFEKILTDRPGLGHRLYRFILSSMTEQLRHANRRLAAIF